MQQLTLFGPAWSAYVRTTRLTLYEKQLNYQLVNVDFSNGDMPPEHLARHPFGKVPVLQHGDFWVYESVAIGHYLGAAFAGPTLVPTAPRPLSRMIQIIAILDNYISADIRMGYVYEQLFKPMLNLPVDHAHTHSSEQHIIKGFDALATIVDDGSFLIGDQLSLADLHAIPLFDYLSLTPGGNRLIQSQAVLESWWDGVRNRESVLSSAYDLTIFNPNWRNFISPCQLG